MKLQFVYDIMFICYVAIANGDISFGSNIIRPTFVFVGTLPPPPSPQFRFISFRLNSDNILEGQEVGRLTIAPSTNFDGFAPRFQTVMIVINDSNSEWIVLYSSFIHYCQFVYTHCGGSILKLLL